MERSPIGLSPNHVHQSAKRIEHGRRTEFRDQILARWDEPAFQLIRLRIIDWKHHFEKVGTHTMTDSVLMMLFAAGGFITESPALSHIRALGLMSYAAVFVTMFKFIFKEAFLDYLAAEKERREIFKQLHALGFTIPLVKELDQSQRLLKNLATHLEAREKMRNFEL